MASAVGDALSSITSKLIEQHLMAMLLNKKEVASNSAVAATGAAKSAAQIPFIGWLLAIGAAAAVFGAMSSYSAEGGFDVPGSLAPMTKLHPKEMVLPAQYADVIRGLAGGPGGSGGAGGDVHQHTWNVNAIDARSFDQFLRTGGGRAIAAEMSRQYSMFNSNLRGKA